MFEIAQQDRGSSASRVTSWQILTLSVNIRIYRPRRKLPITRAQNSHLSPIALLAKIAVMLVAPRILFRYSRFESGSWITLVSDRSPHRPLPRILLDGRRYM